MMRSSLLLLLLAVSATAFVCPTGVVSFRQRSSALFYTNTDPDYYQILGIAKTATSNEIKSAYRRLAKQYHPDVSGDNTVEQFHTVHRAYEVLNDPSLKHEYDISVSSPFAPFGGFGFEQNGRADAAEPSFSTRTTVQPKTRTTTSSPFGEWNNKADDPFGFGHHEHYTATRADSTDPSFSTRTTTAHPKTTPSPFGSRNKADDPFVGAGFGQYRSDGFAPNAADCTIPKERPTRRNTSRRAGNDIRYDLEIDFKTSVFGGQETIIISHLETCETCRGVKESFCNTCKGHGVTYEMTRTSSGATQMQETCHTCHGAGTETHNLCHSCHGQELLQRNKQLVVTIPAGVQDFNTLKLSGEGDACPNGGPAGDLYVHVSIRPHAHSRRDGMEIHSESEIDIVDAILGTYIKCPVVDGDVTIEVPPGCQPGQVMR